MKKLFTLLILACAFLAGWGQTAEIITAADATIATDKNSVTFTKDGVTLLTITSDGSENTTKGTISNNSKTVTYNNQTYDAIEFLGTTTSGGALGSNFTPVFGKNVTKVTMIAIREGSSSTTVKNGGINGTSITIYPNSGETTNVGKLAELELVNNQPINIGAARIEVIFLIEYMKVNNFQVIAQNISQTSVDLSVSYTVSNAPEDATYKISYQLEEGDPETISASETGVLINLTGLVAATEYKYNVSLFVNEDSEACASTSVSFTTKSEPSAPFYVNYAQIAASTFPYNTNIGPATEGNYTYRDTNNAIRIGNNDNNKFYQFYVMYNGKEIISKDDFLIGGNVSLRFGYGNNNATGLITTGNSSQRYGVFNVTEGDIVEIAILTGGDFDSTTAPETSSLVNLTYKSESSYTFEFDNDGTQTVKYKVYSYTVNEGFESAAFIVPASTYIAYISVNPYQPENGYYLVGSMTTEYDGGWVPNPSYKFQPAANDDSTATDDEDDTATSTTPSKYTLTVGSLSSTDKYYVAAVNDGTITYYSSAYAVDKDMTPGTEVPLKAGYTNQMGTENNYLNVIFTLNMDVEAGVPNGLSFTGTEDTNIKSVVITTGNDKTYQSGTVEGQTITMQTENDAVLLYVYVPEGGYNVQYATANVKDYNATSIATQDDDNEDLEWENASKSSLRPGAYEVSLPTGKTGLLYVKYTDDDGNEVETEDPYSFTVLRTTPTAVEAIEAVDGPAEYFNLQGVKIANPDHGIFIKVQNGKASKVIL